MRTIIAGSRKGPRPADLEVALRVCGWAPTLVISGTARGADQIGEEWAAAHRVPVERFPADWNRYGKRAGYLRNVQMADRAEALIALWDGDSQGTKHMIDIGRAKGLLVHVQLVRPVLSTNWKLPSAED